MPNKEPQVIIFQHEPSLADLEDAILELGKRLATGKLYVTFRRPVNLPFTVGQDKENVSEAYVKVFIDERGRPAYTFHRASGFPWERVDYGAIERFTWVPEGWENPAEWAAARWRILDALHPNAWPDLKDDPAFCEGVKVSDMKLVKVQNVPDEMKRAIRAAFKKRYNWHLKWREKRGDDEFLVKVDCAEDTDRIFRAYYREQKVYHQHRQLPDGSLEPFDVLYEAGREWVLLNPSTMTLPKPFQFGPYGKQIVLT